MKMIEKQGSLIAIMVKVLVFWTEDESSHNNHLSQGQIHKKPLTFFNPVRIYKTAVKESFEASKC